MTDWILEIIVAVGITLVSLLGITIFFILIIPLIDKFSEWYWDKW